MTERYAVRTLADDRYPGEGVYELRDLQTGSSARVAAAAGNNLFSLRVPIRGREIEVMPGPETGFPPDRRLGNPILFPFPGRVRAGRFSFGGREHQLDANRSGHAIHGLVSRLPWTVEAAGPSPEGARIVSTLRSADHPEIGRQWPYPFRISVSFTLRGDGVRMEAEAANLGAAAMPMGFGIHPWFRLPLVKGGSREDCLIKVPASRLWEVDPSILPTGRVLNVPPDRDFRTPRPLGEVTLDDTYTDVQLDGDSSECFLRDPEAGAEVAVRADAGFRELVVYAPPDLPTICLEPLTCVPDALNLQPRGLDAGLIVLDPGASWRGRIWLSVREA